MSAAEVIEMIKKLPPEEKAAVMDFVERERASDTKREIRYVTDAKFDEVAPKVLDKHRGLLRRLAQ